MTEINVDDTRLSRQSLREAQKRLSALCDVAAEDSRPTPAWIPAAYHAVSAALQEAERDNA